MIYQVVNWNRFENDRSRQRDRCSFVCTPNKHDGGGLLAVWAEEDGMAIFGIWNALIQVLSRQTKPRNGWMTDDGTSKGRAWSVQDMCLRFRCGESTVSRALLVLSSERVGWLRSYESPPTNRRLTADSPGSEVKGREGKRREVKGREEKARGQVPAALDAPEFLSAWDEFVRHRQEIRKPLTPTATARVLVKLEAMGRAEAIRAIHQSIENGWQGVFEPKNDVRREKPETPDEAANRLVREGAR